LNSLSVDVLTYPSHFALLTISAYDDANLPLVFEPVFTSKVPLIKGLFSSGVARRH